jgi:hypothetical protein
LPGEAEEAPHPEGFESTSVEAEPVETPPVTRSLTPAGTEYVIDHVPPLSTPQPTLEAMQPFDMIEGESTSSLNRVEEVLEDLAPAPEEPRDDESDPAAHQATSRESSSLIFSSTIRHASTPIVNMTSRCRANFPLHLTRSRPSRHRRHQRRRPKTRAAAEEAADRGGYRGGYRRTKLR